MRSIVGRTVLLVVTINVLTISVILLLIQFETRAQFGRSLERGSFTLIDDTAKQKLAEDVASLWEAEGRDAVAAIGPSPAALRRANGYEFLVLDLDLSVVVHSDPDVTPTIAERVEKQSIKVDIVVDDEGRRRESSLLFLAPRSILDSNGNQIGYALLYPPNAEKQAAVFATQVWERVALAVMILIALVILGPALLLRHELKPIGRLERAAHQLLGKQEYEPLDPQKFGGEFHDLVAALNAAALAIADSERVRRQIISDVGHELRTPLTNIKGQLEALQRGIISADAEFICTMENEARMLERLAKDFQQVAQADAGNIPVTLHPILLPETAGNILRPICEAAGCTLTVDGDESCVALADEERLRQVLTNLFENSIRHRSDGLKIAATFYVDGAEIVGTIDDNGPGIPREQWELVFERFYRGERSRNRATGGSGLGLTIVDGLMRAMGGRVRIAESRLGGALFELRLKAAD